MEAQKKKLFHFRPLFFSFLFLTLAISCAKFLFAGKAFYIALVCSIFSILFIFCLCQKNFVYFVFLLAVFGIGIGWYFLGMSTFQAKSFSGQCQIVARISDSINYSDYGDTCNVILKDVKINGKKSKNIYARINFEDEGDFQVGDVISFTSEVSPVKAFQLEQFNSFYYRNSIGYTSEFAVNQISILKNELKLDEKIRQRVKSKFFGLKNGAICYAVLFGDKSEIDDDMKEAFSSAGVVHLLTVSGLHISFLIALLGFALKKCKIRGWINLLICTSFVIFYAFLCGWTPSVLRAGVMGLVLALATASGKRYDGLSSLGLAGCIILLVKPLFALDVGFLMSFFCVFSIFALCTVLKKFFGKFLHKRIAEGLAISLSAQVGIFPFALKISEGTNFLSFFANLIIVPIFSVIYPILFVSTLLVLFMPFLSFLLKVCDFGFVAVCKLAEFFAQTKLSFEIEALNVLTISCVFLLIFLISKFFMTSKRTKAVCFSMLVCLACVCVTVPDFWQHPQAGVSICYEYSNGINLLTNNAGESVIIDVRSKNFTKKVLKSTNAKKVVAVFVLQNSKVSIETVRHLECENVIRTGSGEGYEEEKLVGLEEAGKVGKFEYKYRSDQGKMIGLEFKFDGKRVLFAREKYTKLEIFKNVGKESFDLVVLGKLQKCAPAFEKTIKIAGFYEEIGVSSSFEKDGNVQFALKKNDFKWRCLD